MSITEEVLQEKRAEIMARISNNNAELARFQNQVEYAERWKVALSRQFEAVDEALEVLT